MFGMRHLFVIIVITISTYTGKYLCAPAPKPFGAGGDSTIPTEDLGDHNDIAVEPTCLADNENPYTFFGTKTTYLHPDIGNENTDEIKLPGKLWAIETNSSV